MLDIYFLVVGNDYVAMLNIFFAAEISDTCDRRKIHI